MKLKRTNLILFLTVACFFLCSTNTFSQQKANQLYEKALYIEEAKGELLKAIDLYQQILKGKPTNRSIAAKTQFHIGLCYEKLGLKQAQKAYREVINNYPDQQGEVAMARERLARLVQFAEKVSKVLLVPKFTKITVPTPLGVSGKLSPDGKEQALVANNKLWKMPLSGNIGLDIAGAISQVNTEGIGVSWTGLAWSGNGQWIAFYEQPLNGKIFIVSSEGGKPKKIAEANVYPTEPVKNLQLSLSPDGKKLAFSSVENHKQFVYTKLVSADSKKQLVDFEAREPAFSPNGKMIAFVGKNPGNGEGEMGLWVIPADGGTPQHVAYAGNATSPEWSPKGNMIAFLDGSRDRKQIYIVPVSKIGEATGKVSTINAPEGTEEVRLLAGWTPDNRIGTLCSSKSEWALYTLPATGGHATIVLHDSRALQPRWSPDSKEIYYTVSVSEDNQSWRNRGLGVVSSEGGKGKILPRNKDATILVPFGFQAGNRVSPDGKMILSSAKLPGSNYKKNYPSTQIWKIPINGNKPIRITNPQGPDTDGSPCWSPDGKKVAFLRIRLAEGDGEEVLHGDGGGIYIVGSTGDELKLLSSVPGKYINSLVWSPDGKMIAYLSASKGESNDSATLNVINVSNSESRVVGEVQSATVNIELAWSPDSKRIAFNDLFGKVINVMSLSDGSIEKISTGGLLGSIYHLDWSSDGDRFVFGGHNGGGLNLWLMENFLPLEKLPQEKENLLVRKEDKEFKIR